MYDYLAAATPDYATETLAIRPHRILYEEGGKPQVVHEADDATIAVVSLSAKRVFFVRLQWDALLPAAAGTIFDLFHNAAKANQYARTFKWEHPLDGHVYVVRFASPLRRGYDATRPGRHSFDELRLRVEGYVS